MENNEYKPRNLIVIADEIIKIIDEECTFSEEKIENIIESIEKVKRDYSYRAPELTYIDWNNFANILSTNFIPSNSKWETKIMIIFNDLSGTVDDYYQD